MNKIVSFSTLKQGYGTLMEVLNGLMSKTNTNINQLSKNTGLANTTIKRICTDSTCNPTLTSIAKIADFFGVTASQLIGAEPLDTDSNSYQPNFNQWQQVPIISLEQLVDWPNNIETVREQTDHQTVMTDLPTGDNTFAMIAEDETLEPKFSAGTILIFDAQKAPKNKDYIVLLMDNKPLPQYRQLLIDGPDQYVKTINPEFAHKAPVALIDNPCRILGVLIQAKSNYV
ncbi:MAG: S24 family peptidase [Coxiellaceae bacterium]|nr:S24 family peptidase [Coxiellaceae bacterium]